jgi:hypothetical protein
MNVVKAVRWKGFKGVMMTRPNGENQACRVPNIFPSQLGGKNDRRVILNKNSGLANHLGRRGLEILGSECSVFVSLMRTAVGGSQAGSHKTERAPWRETGLL